MKENIVQKLTSKDDKYACAFTDINGLSESQNITDHDLEEVAVSEWKE